MSLSSLLLGSKKSVDKDLDSLFKQAPTPIHAPAAGPAASGSTSAQTKEDAAAVSTKKSSKNKRKLDVPTDASGVSSESHVKAKKPKVAKTSSSELSSPSKGAVDADSVAEKGKGAKKAKAEGKKKKDKSKTKKQDVVEGSEDGSEDGSDLERAYVAGKGKVGTPPADEEQEGHEAEESESEEADDAAPIVHESLLKKEDSKSSKSTRRKHAPEDETPEKRNARTIFVGNVPLEVASKRPLEKQLRRHILSFVPSAKIESLRFRSVPFQNPTSKLPTEDDSADLPNKREYPQRPKKDLRAHEAERAANWKSKLDEKDDAFVKKDEKKYLTPAQKKKVAFIHQEFHSQADTVNAYIVFAHPPDTSSRPSNLPALPPTMDPYEAAIVAAKEGDNSLFMEKVLRVDVVAKPSPSEGEDASSSGLGNMDPKMSIFVGNLDFASKEEDLRVYFDQVMTRKRGVPPTESESESSKPIAWVTRVRIVRDKDTQLGKGFAYIQFLDRECVDELLASDEVLKFAKRKLRIQRCKTVPGSKINVTKAPKPEKGAPRQRAHPVPIPPVVVPKGDPALGEKLAGLSKEERKQAKAGDADRLARRLAKKKARMAMGPPKGNGDAGPGGQKQRDRTRKSSAQKKSSGSFNKKASSKPRVRSSKSISQRNTKK